MLTKLVFGKIYIIILDEIDQNVQNSECNSLFTLYEAKK